MSLIILPSLSPPLLQNITWIEGEKVLFVNIALKFSEHFVKVMHFDFLLFAFCTFHNNDLFSPLIHREIPFQESSPGQVQ